MVKTIAEASGIFVVSILLLTALHVVLNINTHRATGLSFYNAKGVMFMVLGAFYVALGLLLSRFHG